MIDQNIWAMTAPLLKVGDDAISLLKCTAHKLVKDF